MTEGGQDDVVILSAEQYRRLKDREARAIAIAELPAGDIRAMLAADLSHLPDDPEDDAAWRLRAGMNRP